MFEDSEDSMNGRTTQRATTVEEARVEPAIECRAEALTRGIFNLARHQGIVQDRPTPHEAPDVDATPSEP
jgi:hypothetical protein